MSPTLYNSSGFSQSETDTNKPLAPANTVFTFRMSGSVDRNVTFVRMYSAAITQMPITTDLTSIESTTISWVHTVQTKDAAPIDTELLRRFTTRRFHSIIRQLEWHLNARLFRRPAPVPSPRSDKSGHECIGAFLPDHPVSPRAVALLAHTGRGRFQGTLTIRRDC